MARGIFRLVRNYQFLGYLVIVATLKFPRCNVSLQRIARKMGWNNAPFIALLKEVNVRQSHENIGERALHGQKTGFYSCSEIAHVMLHHLLHTFVRKMSGR